MYDRIVEAQRESPEYAATRARWQTAAGNRFLIVAADLCTKWVEAAAVPEARARTVTGFLERVYHRWGYPAETITDNGAPFRNAAWRRFHQRNNISHYVTPVYHQMANPVERRNQELKKLLRVYARDRAENQWDQNVESMFNLLNRAL